MSTYLQLLTSDYIGLNMFILKIKILIKYHLDYGLHYYNIVQLHFIYKG